MKQAITWVIAMAFGGLGGAAFTQWYINRSTVIQYSVNKAVLGTDQTAVVPNLAIQVGDKSVKSLYIYTVKLQHVSGPELENAKVGFELTPQISLIGNTVVQSPSVALDFTCEPFRTFPGHSETRCSARRFNANTGAYAVSFASDADIHIAVSIDAKNTQIHASDIPGTPRSDPFSLVLSVVAATGALLGAKAVVESWGDSRHKRSAD